MEPAQVISERQIGGPFLPRRFVKTAYRALQPLALFFVRVGISADFLSWCALGLGGLAGLLIALGHLEYAGVAAALSGVLDAIDGLVARASFTDSREGKVLDSTLDRYVEFFVIGGAIYFFRADTLALLAGLAALLGSFMVSYSTALAEISRVSPHGGWMRRAERMLVFIAGLFFASVELPGVRSPLVLAMLLIAVLANLSAIQRIRGAREALRRARSAPGRAGESRRAAGA